MASIYHLGWPGMELLPCIIVDQESREMYHIKKPLPTRKASLVTPENKFVEFAKVLSFFDLDKQQEAMNTFMSISSDYSVRKFFMDNNQKAYISVDTLLVYVMVYPKCPAFEKARRQTIYYLQEWLDYPCLECGFIKRSGCLCSEDNPCDGEKTEYIGFCTESVDRQIQTDLTSGMLASTFSGAVAPPFQQPPLPPLVTPFLSQHTSQAIASVMPTQMSSGLLSTPRIASVMPVVSNISVSRTTILPAIPQPQHEDRLLVRAPPPVQAVAPLVQVKPKMRDIGIQTRANFDFTPRNRGRKKKDETVDPNTPALADPYDRSFSSNLSTPATASPSVSASQTDDSKAADTEKDKKDNAIPSTSGTTPSLPFPQTVASQAAQVAASSDPIKVSLWKLLDSDSEDEEDLKKKQEEKKIEDDKIKKEEEERKEQKAKEIEALQEKGEKEAPDIERAMREGFIIDPVSGLLVDKDGNPYPKPSALESEGISEDKQLAEQADTEKGTNQADEANGKSGQNSSETEVDPKYQEAPLSNAKELVDSLLLAEENDADIVEHTEIQTNVTEQIMSAPKKKDESEDIHLTEQEKDQDKIDELPGTSVVEDDIIPMETGDIVNTDVTTNKDSKKINGNDKSDETRNESSNQETTSQRDDERSLETTSMDVDATETQTDKDSVANLNDKSDETQLDDTPREADVSPECVDKTPEDVTPIQTETVCKQDDDTLLDKKVTKGPVFVLTNEPVNPSTDTTKEGEAPALNIDIRDEPLTIDLANGEETPKELSAEEKIKQEKEETEKINRKFKKWYHKFEYVPTQEKIYRCTFKRCGQCFDTKLAAELHNRVHGLFGQEHSTSLLCYQCDYTAPLSRWFDIVRHLKDKHKETITKDPLGCHFCGQTMENEEKLYRHIDFHYMGRYKCVFCGTVLFTWKQMEMHLESGCGQKNKREKHLGCPYCPLVFHLRNMRNAHMLAHTDEGLVCCFCKDNNLWESWTELRKHYQQKHGEKIRSAINPHRNIKTPINIQKCPECHVCAHQSKTQEDFIYHMRKKHDFIPYVLSQCEVCEKTFKSEKMFDWHMKHTHGNEVRCPKCDFVARNDLQLKAHDESHHHSKEFECMECGKEFRLYHQLRLHMAHHALHNIYNCKECGAEFKRQKDLRVHVKKEHPVDEERPKHKCPDCDWDSFNKRALEMHIKRNHPKLAEEIEESETHAVPVTPDHGYFNTKTSPLDGSRPALRDRRAPSTRSSERRTSERRSSELVIDEDNEIPPPPPPKRSTSTSAAPTSTRRKSGKKKKGAFSYHNKKKLASKKIPYQAELDENGDPIEPEMSEKRRLRLEIREKIEVLKERIKESSVRTRTYEENRDLKNLKRKKKDDIEDASANTTTAEDGEHEPKRQRVSKYGRNLAPKTYGDDTYEAPKTRERRQVTRPRRFAIEGAIAPPDTWDDEANTKYPYTDHSYFSLDFAADSTDYQKMVSRSQRELRSPEYRPPQDKWSSYMDDAAPGTSQGLQHTYRIGPGGIRRPHQKYTQHQLKRKQRLGSGFTQLQPDSRGMSHDYITIQNPNQDAPQQQQGRDDMTFDDLDSDLIREVSQDPLLQNIIDSMDQQNVNGQGINSGHDSPNKAYLQAQQQGGMTSQARQTMPPSSLNLTASVSQVLAPMSPPSTPARPGTSGQQHQQQQQGPNPNAGLTPTKQSVIDLLLSKIELNEDQLNRLIEEQNKDEVVPDGSSATAQTPATTSTVNSTKAEGEVISLEQLAGGNIASITRISEGQATSGQTLELSTGNENQQTAQEQISGSEDVPIANEVRVHAGSDTDSNPDLEGEMVQAGVVPPPPESEGQGGDGEEEEMDVDVTSTPFQQTTRVASATLGNDGSVTVRQSISNPPQGSQSTIGQIPTGNVAGIQSSSAQGSGPSFRAITMPDGRGGTVRKIVRLVSKEGASSTASQLIKSHLVPDTSSTLSSENDNRYSPVGASGQSQHMNVSGAQISISSTPLGSTIAASRSGVVMDQSSVSGQRTITTGPQIIQQPATSAAAPPTTRIIRRVLTEGGPHSSQQQPQQQQHQQGAMKRIVQVAGSNPQGMAQRRIVTMGRQAMTSIRPRGSEVQVVRNPMMRSRPRGRPPTTSQPMTIVTSQQGRLRQLAPAPSGGTAGMVVASGPQVVQIARRPSSGEGSIRLVSGSPAPVELSAQAADFATTIQAPAGVSIQAPNQDQPTIITMQTSGATSHAGIQQDHTANIDPDLQ